MIFDERVDTVLLTRVMGFAKCASKRLILKKSDILHYTTVKTRSLTKRNMWLKGSWSSSINCLAISAASLNSKFAVSTGVL
jgi:hypothetical protein